MPPLKARTVRRKEMAREESWPAVEPRDGIRRGGGSRSDLWDDLAAGALGADAPVGVHTPPRLNLPHRRIRDSYVRWCGRGEAVRPLPIPIRRQKNAKDLMAQSREHA